MNTSFRRLLNLVRRTGDRLVVTDPEGEDTFVVMDLDQYEALLAAEEHMRSHRHPVASNPVQAAAEAPEPPADIWDVLPPAGSEAETWDYAKMTPEERVAFERQFGEAAGKTEKEPISEPPVQAVSVSEETGEKPSEPKDSEDFGEEQFYLEPIE